MKRPLLLTVLLLTSIWIVMFRPQSLPAQEEPSDFKPKTQFDSLIEEAQAAGTRDGAIIYSRHLISMLIEPKAGDAYITSLSRRVGTADLMARHAKRKWISESSVAQAFNELMLQVTEPKAKPTQTDATAVHQIRLRVHESVPALSSVQINASECLPSEAVFVIVQLLQHGGITESDDQRKLMPGHLGSVTLGTSLSSPNSLVFRYTEMRSRFETVKLYDHMILTLGF